MDNFRFRQYRFVFLSIAVDDISRQINPSKINPEIDLYDSIL